MLQVIYSKLGENRGLKRIWIEGRKLLMAGILPGKKYRVETDNEARSLRIIIDQNGTHVVSKKRRHDDDLPLIDINNQSITDLLGASTTRIKAVIYEGYIEVHIHPDEIAKQRRLERLQNEIREGTISTGSISTGLGVLDHAIHQGLEMAGLKAKLRFGNELETSYLEASLKNNPIWEKDSLAISGSMMDIRPEDIPEASILCAGIPCSGASRAGRSKLKLQSAEEHAKAGNLFLAFLNVVNICNAAIVLLENTDSFASTASATVIRTTLEQWGYTLHETMLEGNKFGALESRRRFCLVAVTEGIEFDIETLSPVRQKEACLNEILDDIPDNDPMYSDYTYLVEKQKRDIQQGKGFRMARYNPDAVSVNTIVRNYAKVQSTSPMLNHPHKPELMRLFTKGEHARIKTVPEYLVDGLANSVAHQCLGQSVIHCAFKALGRHLGNALKGEQLSPVIAMVNNTLAPATDTQAATPPESDDMNNDCDVTQMGFAF